MSHCKRQEKKHSRNVGEESKSWERWDTHYCVGGEEGAAVIVARSSGLRKEVHAFVVIVHFRKSVLFASSGKKKITINRKIPYIQKHLKTLSSKQNNLTYNLKMAAIFLSKLYTYLPEYLRWGRNLITSSGYNIWFINWRFGAASSFEIFILIFQSTWVQTPADVTVCPTSRRLADCHHQRPKFTCVINAVDYITTVFWVNKINFLNSSPTSLLSLSLITCIMRFTRYKGSGMCHTYSFPSLPSRSIYKRKCSAYILNLQQTENFILMFFWDVSLTLVGFHVITVIVDSLTSEMWCRVIRWKFTVFRRKIQPPSSGSDIS